MIELCDYYVKNEAERERIAENGRQKLITHHTDEVRARFLLEQLSKLM